MVCSLNWADSYWIHQQIQEGFWQGFITAASKLQLEEDVLCCQLGGLSIRLWSLWVSSQGRWRTTCRALRATGCSAGACRKENKRLSQAGACGVYTRQTLLSTLLPLLMNGQQVLVSLFCELSEELTCSPFLSALHALWTPSGTNFKHKQA